MKKSMRYVVLSVLMVAVYSLSACSGAIPSLATGRSGAPKVQADTVAFTGMVETMNGNQWVVGGKTVSVDASLVSSNIQVGDTIRVEGKAGLDGMIVATSVKPYSPNSATETSDPSATVEPSETPGPSETAEPSDTPDPSQTVEPSDTPDPSQTVEPSDTPEPSQTVEPSDTPDPSETPNPSETPDASSSAGFSAAAKLFLGSVKAGKQLTISTSRKGFVVATSVAFYPND